MAHHLQRELRLALQLPGRLRHTNRCATGCIVRPTLGQIQPRVDQRRVRPSAQRREHADLAVVDLAQTSVPLPCDPNRTLPLLGDAAFIDQQGRLRRATQQRILQGDLIQDSAFVPAGVGEEVLQHLIVALGHDLGHALHVLTPCLHPAAQILLRLREYVARAQSKVIGEAVTKVQRALTHRCQWAFCITNPLQLV